MTEAEKTGPAVTEAGTQPAGDEAGKTGARDVEFQGSQGAERTEKAPLAPKQKPGEIGGPQGPEPTRYGDWEVGGRCTDF